MNICERYRPLFLVCVLTSACVGALELGCNSCFAQTPIVEPAIKQLRPLRGHPIVLFDGSTLDGWQKRDGSESKNWIAEDGTLFRKSGGGDLYHKDWYRDFELTFEWKISEKGNSGVKYRVHQFGKQMLGCEYQIQDDMPNKKKEGFGRHSTGALYAVYEPSKKRKTNPVGEWNKSKIVVSGNKIEHWLNGEKIVDASVASLDWIKRVERSKFGSKYGFGENREGRIFLQDHGKPVWYRNIVVVPLDSDHLTYQ